MDLHQSALQFTAVGGRRDKMIIDVVRRKGNGMVSVLHLLQFVSGDVIVDRPIVQGFCS